MLIDLRGDTWRFYHRRLGVGGVKHFKGAWNHGGHHGSVLNVTFSTVFKIYLPAGSRIFVYTKMEKNLRGG